MNMIGLDTVFLTCLIGQTHAIATSTFCDDSLQSVMEYLSLENRMKSRLISHQFNDNFKHKYQNAMDDTKRVETTIASVSHLSPHNLSEIHAIATQHRLNPIFADKQHHFLLIARNRCIDETDSFNSNDIQKLLDSLNMFSIHTHEELHQGPFRNASRELQLLILSSWSVMQFLLPSTCYSNDTVFTPNDTVFIPFVTRLYEHVLDNFYKELNVPCLDLMHANAHANSDSVKIQNVLHLMDNFGFIAWTRKTVVYLRNQYFSWSIDERNKDALDQIESLVDIAGEMIDIADLQDSRLYNNLQYLLTKCVMDIVDRYDLLNGNCSMFEGYQYENVEVAARFLLELRDFNVHKHDHVAANKLNNVRRMMIIQSK